MISHATPIQRDVTYDHRAQLMAMPISIHHRAGTAEETILVLTPDEVELYSTQFEKAIQQRETARGEGLTK